MDGTPNEVHLTWEMDVAKDEMGGHRPNKCLYQGSQNLNLRNSMAMCRMNIFSIPVGCVGVW